MPDDETEQTPNAAPQPEPEPTPARKSAAPAEPEPTYTRAEVLAVADSYGTSVAHLGAALHRLGRPERVTRSQVQDALAQLAQEG